MVMPPDTNDRIRMLPFGEATLHSWYSVRAILRLIIEQGHALSISANPESTSDVPRKISLFTRRGCSDSRQYVKGSDPLGGKRRARPCCGRARWYPFSHLRCECRTAEMPALLEPELLELSASQCQKIELNGRTEQSDFRAGYLIAPNGRLQRLMPSYGGRLYLDHGWAFWRTYRGPYIVRHLSVCLPSVMIFGVCRLPR